MISPPNRTVDIYVRCLYLSQRSVMNLCFRNFTLLLHRRSQSTISTRHLPTIYALSTPTGQRSAIAVVRVSGGHAKYIYRALTKTLQDPKPRTAILKKLYNPKSQVSRPNLLDHALTLFFPTPKSFTGEDVLELHIHGGKAVTRSVLKAIESLHDETSEKHIRYANAGEFSLRAFQNGKFDLTEIEGIRELIDAETESQRRSALSSLNGENRNKFDMWRSQIIANIAQLTAIIDFGEDTEMNDINDIFDTVETNMLRLKREIKDFIIKIEKSSILQSGIKLVLLGQPNAGKSSLINAISNEDISIVSQIPGTTRDALENLIEVNGFKVKICDTAGIRDNISDQIELLGIEKAIKKSHYCDICLILIDPTQKPLLSNEMKKILKSSQFVGKEIVIVINKKDLISGLGEKNSIESELRSQFDKKHPIIAISCLNFDGITNLVNKLTEMFQHMSDSGVEFDPIAVSQRVREILRNDILFGIEQFLINKQLDNDVVMASESLSHVADGIGKITGETVGIEEILGVVFSSFCVGK
ncbi:hypothetical protein HG535_0G03450 [Zygotorulaspora mrakii]|uniref:TrmE-type G domain-containing protein n=1 Tax=Zygotorulaspora mrakii TaxID=42260 RepID=A0A7H9B9R1_ZYGMR|nr:uncharacterized protein HG535_0G03450 [Zygotorulaspora mrakii]QLG74462.1 hypothetical protein HG535_0G03450 [Zygotorulaspora mrakii]